MAYHLHLLARHSAAHVRASCRWEQSGIAKLVDPLLPCLGRFVGWVDIFETLTFRKLDRILDPAALDLDRRRTVREECGSVGAVQVVSVKG